MKPDQFKPGSTGSDDSPRADLKNTDIFSSDTTNPASVASKSKTIEAIPDEALTASAVPFSISGYEASTKGQNGSEINSETNESAVRARVAKLIAADSNFFNSFIREIYQYTASVHYEKQQFDVIIERIGKATEKAQKLLESLGVAV